MKLVIRVPAGEIMQHLPQHTADRPDRKSETLKYIAEMLRQLAAMADDVGDATLAYGLRQMAAAGDVEEPMPRH